MPLQFREEDKGSRVKDNNIPACLEAGIYLEPTNLLRELYSLFA